jgi:hypothetical protein
LFGDFCKQLCRVDTAIKISPSPAEKRQIWTIAPDNSPGYLNPFNSPISITLCIVQCVDKVLHNSPKSKARWSYLNPSDLACASENTEPDPFDPSLRNRVANWWNSREVMVYLGLIICNVCFLTDHSMSLNCEMLVIFNQKCPTPLRNFTWHAPYWGNILWNKCGLIAQPTQICSLMKWKIFQSLWYLNSENLN